MLRRLGLAVFLLSWPISWPSPARAERFTASTPDEGVDRAYRVAMTSRDPATVASRLLWIARHRDRSRPKHADYALSRLGWSASRGAVDARWLLAALHPAGTPAAGLVTQFQVIGPYRPAELDRREGPDLESFRWAGASSSHGATMVRATAVSEAAVDGRGLDLDRYVDDRAETCSYVATVLERADTAGKATLRIAASGAYRLSVDGDEVLRDERVHRGALLDRGAVVLGPGRHRITAKVCSGTQPDDGLVRLHLVDASGVDASGVDVSGVDASGRDVPVSTHLHELDSAPSAGPIEGPAPTLLQATLAASKPALTHAVTAILAEADDLRSPRAPGWLDRAVLTGDPDQLATAGAVSPSHATRSRWLSAARRGSDDAARDFADRELVLARHRVGLHGMAYELAQQAALSEKADLDARWLALLTEGSLDPGAALGARGRMLRSVAPTYEAPNSLYRQLLTWKVPPPDEQRALIRLASTQVGLSHTPRYLNAFTAAPNFVAIAEDALARRRSAAEGTAIAELLLDLGYRETATEGLMSVTRDAPNHAPAWFALARALASASATNEQLRTRIAALERGLALRPSTPGVEASLAVLRSEERNRPRASRWLVSPKVFLKRAPPLGAGDDRPLSRELHYRRVVTWHDDGRVSQVLHWSRQITRPPRDVREREENLPGGDILLARIHRRGGAIEPPERRDERAATVRWPPLEAGDVLEVAVEVWTPGPVGKAGDAPFFIVDYAGSQASSPLLYNEVFFDLPKSGSPLHWEVRGGTPTKESESIEKGRRITRLRFERPAVVASEPGAPALSEAVPVVVASTFPDWSSFTTWYRKATVGFTDPDAQIERLARELTRGKAGREAKLEALFRFVSDDIRYVNYRSGEWWLPNRPQTLLERRQGDCDDKSMLLISLLKAVGIRAEEALVQSRLHPAPRLLRGRRVAIPYFDHGIVFLPDAGGGRFLDPTSPHNDPRALPAMDAGGLALRLDRGELVAIPRATAADHGRVAEWQLVLDGAGHGSLKGRETHRGDEAFRLRSQLSSSSARPRFVAETLLADHFTGIEVAPEVGFTPYPPKGGATLTYAGSVRGVARADGADLVVDLSGAVPAWAPRLAKLSARRRALTLPPTVAPRRHAYRWELVAPEGFSFAAPPPAEAAGAGSLGAARVSFQGRGRKLVVDYELRLEATQVEAADYPRWRRMLQRADRFLTRPLRLVRNRRR